MANIRDVARVSGVSVGTVSRVFNQHPTVSADIASRVEEAVRQLGYTPVRPRRPGPVPGLRFHKVALVTLGIDSSLASLPVIASLLQGVHDAATALGLGLLVCHAPDPADLPSSFKGDEIDGVLVKAALQGDMSQSVVAQAIAALPHVWLTGRPAGCAGDACGSDDYAVGRMAAEHLVGKGHRKLVFLNPKPDHTAFAARQAAFVWHAERLGASVTEVSGKPMAQGAYPVRPVSNLTEVRRLVSQLLETHGAGPLPLAVFVPADSIAVLIYRAMAERGLSVGHDISLISCNAEKALCRGLYPTLTTIDIHSAEMGSRGVDQLVWRISHPVDAVEGNLSLSPTLVEGDSVLQV